MTTPIEFPTRAAAICAIKSAVDAKRCEGGYVSGPATGRGGALIYRAHVHGAAAQFAL